MPEVEPEPEILLYRWQDAVTRAQYADRAHFVPPAEKPPLGWAVSPGLDGVWKPYAAPSALLVRWRRLIGWVGLPDDDTDDDTDDDVDDDVDDDAERGR